VSRRGFGGVSGGEGGWFLRAGRSRDLDQVSRSRATRGLALK
jgi:hypothetical protein